MSEIGDRLARVETKIDILLEDRGKLADVERRQWYQTGGLAVVALALAKLGIPWPPH